MIEETRAWLENSWSFKDIIEVGTEQDYNSFMDEMMGELKKAVTDGNLEGFFMWLETSKDFEAVWAKGIEAYNKNTDDFSYSMTYYQFKTMMMNKVKELVVTTVPNYNVEIWGTEDQMKST